jgi:hypothetical protein
MSVAVPASRTLLPALRNASPTALHRLAGQLARRRALWEPHVRFAHQHRSYVRIAETATYEAWLLTWAPGTTTGLHDHGGSAGAFAVVEGALEELVPLGRPLAGSPPPHLQSRRLGRGRVRSFGPSHVHEVRNTGTVHAVSVHVYAPALGTMRRYDVDAAGLLRVASDERAGVDW